MTAAEVMKAWPYPVQHTAREEIQEAIADPYWQQVRLSMKGISTSDKLIVCRNYMREQEAKAKTDHARRMIVVRIDNYINALLRGGQLIEQGGKIIVNR